MNNTSQIACAEVDKILEYLPRKNVLKIPLKIRKYIKKNKLKEYKFSLDMNKPLETQNLQRKTLVLLAIFNLHYWSSQEEKDTLFKLYIENEEAKQKELSVLYDSDNIFKNKNNHVKQNEDVAIIEESSLVEYKGLPILKKIFLKILRLFIKTNNEE